MDASTASTYTFGRDAKHHPEKRTKRTPTTPMFYGYDDPAGDANHVERMDILKGLPFNFQPKKMTRSAALDGFMNEPKGCVGSIVPSHQPGYVQEDYVRSINPCRPKVH